jgi:hypothetical protein
MIEQKKLCSPGCQQIDKINPRENNRVDVKKDHFWKELISGLR